MTDEETRQLIIFDGQCNLCRCSILFIINRDSKERFSFAKLDTEAARKALEEFGDAEDYAQSVSLISGKEIYTRSTAILRVARQLDGLWPALYAFIIVPKTIRDGVYGFISRKRHQWFGKSGACMIPADEMGKRFVD